MIDLYSGTPGSGKSLHVASYIYLKLKRGDPVIGNFDVNLQLFGRKKVNYTRVENSTLTPEFLIEYSKNYWHGRRIREDKIMLVLDECQLLFNARDWSKKGRDTWLSFFTQHRKYGYHIILIAQFDMMIDKQIRSLIEYNYIHRKLSNFGFRGKLLSLFLGGQTFIAVQVWYPLNLKVGHELFHARRRLYRLYDSYGTFDTEKTQPPHSSGTASTAAEA